MVYTLCRTGTREHKVANFAGSGASNGQALINKCSLQPAYSNPLIQATMAHNQIQ